MDLDSLFSSQRWNILEIIAKKPSSPLEISEELNTSVAYVSQQLKLLEFAGIVIKEKTGFFEKGKPRNLYKISEDLIYISFLSEGESAKKSIHADEFRKIIIRIWLIEDLQISRSIEKIFWTLEAGLKDIDGIYLDVSEGKSTLLILSDSKKVKQSAESLSKKIEIPVKVKVDSKENFGFEKLSDFYFIYGTPLREQIGEKGGKEEK